MRSIWSKISDWVSFRTMVTPVLLKVVFQFHFWIMNGLVLVPLGIWDLFAAVLVATQPTNNQGFKQGAAIVAVAIFLNVFLIAVLIVANILTRVSYELSLLLFNIYDSLKVIEAQHSGSGPAERGPRFEDARDQPQ